MVMMFGGCASQLQTDTIPKMRDGGKENYMKKLLWIVAVVLIVSGLFSISTAFQEDGEDVAFFSDVTEGAGLKDVTGGRVAWGDFDNDGWDDLLVDGCQLFKNNGKGGFVNVTKDARIGSGSGAVWADFNNDGFLDFIAISGQGTAPANGMWKNNGDGTFTDVTKDMGFVDNRNLPTEGAGWGDYDRDGYVDLYIANYERQGEKEMSKGTPDVFWRNEGGKRFKDVTDKVKMKLRTDYCGRGVNWGDFNNDGFLDIYVSNYRLQPNLLWRNNGDGTFTNVAGKSGCRGDEEKGVYGHTIGSAWADFDNDGFMDIICGQLAHPQFRKEYKHPMTMLYKNSGPPDWKFTNLNPKGAAGIKYEETHSSPAVADFDNDGFLDFYITSVYEGRRSFLYRNKGDMTFEDITRKAGVRVRGSWGCGWSDYDHDGDMDLAVAGVAKNSNIKLFRNDLQKERGHWLEVRLEGSDCNRAAIGARVTVKVGDKKYIREVEGGTGTTCQNSLTCHFGLGAYDREAEVTIRWQCGGVQQVTTAVDKLISVKEKGTY